LKSKKPSKEKLEEHLRAGARIADIARKYESSVQSVHNWIKAYGLQDIQSVPKPKAEESAQDTPPVEDMVKESPKADIEQPDAPPSDAPISSSVQPDKPLAITMESEVVDPNPAPRETFDEIWQDVRSDLATLERLYVADARKSFRERLREMLADVVGELPKEEKYIG